MKKTLTLSATIIFSLNVFSQSPNWVWAKSMGDSLLGGGNGFSIATDASGNVYTSGSFGGTVDFDPGAGVFNMTANGYDDIFISKSDSAGNFIWTKAMGDTVSDWGYSIAIDALDNVYITGYFQDTVDFDPGTGTFILTAAGNIDIFILKLDSAGNFIWAKTMGSTNNDFGHSIALDASANVYISGQFSLTVDFDPGVGVFNLTSAGGFDIFVCKLDSSGNFVWAKAMGGTGNDYAESIALDASGNIYSTGVFVGTVDLDPDTSVNFILNAAGGTDIFISKLDNSGNFVWAKAIGGTSNDFPYDIAIDAQGDVYATGYFKGTADFDPGAGTFNLIAGGLADIFISKLDSSGNFRWAKAFVGVGNDEGHAVTIDASDNVYIAGWFSGTVDFDPGAGTFNLASAGQQDIFLSKLDSSGNFRWAKTVGGTKTDIGRSLTISTSGNVYMTGFFHSPSINFGATTLTGPGMAGNSNDIFIAKLDTAIVTGNNEIKSFVSSTTLSPNPFHETATLTINTIPNQSGIEVGTIEIIPLLAGLGSTAQQPKHFTGNKITLQRNNLPAGIYFYTITLKENIMLHGKFIIQ
jgi:hypothetical protein